MTLEDELDLVTYKIHLYLVKVGEPVGPRDVMRAIDLSSPAVAHRGLSKLVDLGLAEKDGYGRYSVVEKANFKGYVWVGKNLVPRLLIYSFFFLGLLISEIMVVYTRWIAQEPLELYLGLAAITALSVAIFLFESLQLKRNKF